MIFRFEQIGFVLPNLAIGCGSSIHQPVHSAHPAGCRSALVALESFEFRAKRRRGHLPHDSHQRLSAPSAGRRRVETLQVRRLSDPGGISDERAHVEAEARLQQPCAPARAEREWEIVQPAPPLIGRSPHRSTNPRRAESRVRSARRYEKRAGWMGMIL